MHQENEQKNVVVSWSGGKDCCLALHRVLEEGYHVFCLLSMVSRKDKRNRLHGIPLEVLQMQADSLGIPLKLVDTDNGYEQSLQTELSRLNKDSGVNAAVFGSLYQEEDRTWNEKIAIRSGLEPLFPVWGSSDESLRLLREFVSLGYRAKVCRASEKFLDQSWVDRILDDSFINDIRDQKICPMGEFGEYHTFVVDGPIFSKKIEITQSEVVLNSGLWSLDIRKARFGGKNEN